MIPRDILELLTRFELVTRFTPKSFQLLGGPTPFTWGCAPNPRRTCGDGRGQEKQKIDEHFYSPILGAANQI